MKAHLGNQSVQVLEKSKNLLNLNRTLGTISSTTNIPFDESKYYKGLSGSNYLQPNQVTDITFTSNAISITNVLAGYGVCLPVKCLPSTTYICSFEYELLEQARNISSNVGFYTEDGSFIRYRVIINNNSFTTPSNCYWMTLCFSAEPVTIKVPSTIIVSNIMLVQGNTATEYAPYIRRFNFHSAVNLIKMPYANGLSKTQNGITFTVDEKTGWITVNGTSTGLASFYMKDMSWSMAANESFVKGKFLLRGCPTGGNYDNTYYIVAGFINAEDKRIYVYSYDESKRTIEVGDGRKYAYAVINIRPNVTVNNLVFKPELIKLLGD